MELIITEKPSSARKIAAALADASPKEKKKNGVNYWEFTHEGKLITVVSAVGHLFTVAEDKKKKGWTYPVFDIKWVPSYEVDKNSAHTEKYLKTIRQIAKKADSITIATDYDIEGEVIGYTILAHGLGKEDGQRMKFSTVTAKDLKNSYDNKQETITWGQANAGVTRHELDWFYGINLSRALTLSVKAAGGFKILSSGRVQTPALKMLADREREINAFVPEPYWQVELHTEHISAMHETDKFWKQKEADAVQKNVTEEASVTSIAANQRKQVAPNPFDLTTLQTEAYRSFGMSPKETLQHAQSLYTGGWISYPRTSSQQLPVEIGYEHILQELAKQKNYKKLAEVLLAEKSLKPNNGKKTDAAHPAIYPTGVKPDTRKQRAMKVYDLVVRRFMATFGPDATRETMTVKLDSGGEVFVAKGTRTIEPGWHVFYGDHVKLAEEELPELKEGQKLIVEECAQYEKSTQPPKRYTPSSIIRELEKRGLGTKATRADIVESLFYRGYVSENSIEVSELGLKTIDTLEKYVPEIIDEKLTKEIEEDLEEIRDGKETQEEVIAGAKKHLTEILTKINKHEKEIGKELLVAHRESQDAATQLGPSPDKTEGHLVIKRSKFGFFVGSSLYPDCTSTFKLPTGRVKPAHKYCPYCKYPLIEVTAKRRGKRLHCINHACAGKEPIADERPRLHALEVDKPVCPRCSEGHLEHKASVYGTFVACSRYPKCRYSEPVKSVWDSDPDKLKGVEDIPPELIMTPQSEKDASAKARKAAKKK